MWLKTVLYNIDFISRKNSNPTWYNVMRGWATRNNRESIACCEAICLYESEDLENSYPEHHFSLVQNIASSTTGKHTIRYDVSAEAKRKNV